MNLGVALAGGAGNRRADDFYPTPPEATLALIQVAWPYIGHVIHEPACGDGAMARVLQMNGYDVIATDLVYRGYGQGGVDYLSGPSLAKNVITNPPFKLAARFIEHALAQQPSFFAVLLKASFWNANARADLLDREPPRLTMPLTWRLDFTGGGAPTMDCTWFAWDSAVPRGLPPVPLRKPNMGAFA
ncbi:SAM-dependent methyltransferase [Mesorhizobium sp. ESP7-2]|uniref:SAM-dependent methyltransferase n=1 Tax=Mesorhizobium sp. ESP7-2 TaxID=2876622 RepID=UPI001CCB12EE|nr:SAM-dependent methyltransferase [Mesorhizobium sp. ESP7-2]MBZ9706102.1 SAM-dependent methyltransferase [Mesorhizobium sp. ESP7-2]